MARPLRDFGRNDHETVAILAAAGMPERDIAVVLECARGTLRTHFADELAHGRVRCRAQVLKALYAAARAPGNVSAAKAWLALTDTPRAAESEPLPLRVVGAD
jgi:hypothetical protein